MIPFEILFAVIPFALAATLTPGPNNMIVLAAGLRGGFSGAVPVIMGVAVGITIMIPVVGIGLGALFQTFPQLYVVLKFAGVAYLLYLAWRVHRATVADAREDRGPGFLGMVGFQWINPKAWAIAIGAVTAYAPADAVVAGSLVIALGFLLVSIVSQSVWAGFGTGLRRFLQNPVNRQRCNTGMAIVLVLSVLPTVFG